MPGGRHFAHLDLASRSDYGAACVIGGGWGPEDEHGERELILGEVIGGDDAHWRAFADRVTAHQLAEAAMLLQALAKAA